MWQKLFCFRIVSLYVACGRDQFYIKVSIVPIFGSGATLGKRSNWYFLELCCAKLGSLTRWCLVVARRLLALQLLLMFFFSSAAVVGGASCEAPQLLRRRWATVGQELSGEQEEQEELSKAGSEKKEKKREKKEKKKQRWTVSNRKSQGLSKTGVF